MFHTISELSDVPNQCSLKLFNKRHIFHRFKVSSHTLNEKFNYDYEVPTLSFKGVQRRVNSVGVIYMHISPKLKVTQTDSDAKNRRCF